MRHQGTPPQPIATSRDRFNIVGIFAAVIRELREFVKDVWYRNSAERRMWEIIVAAQSLEVMRSHRLTEEQLRRLLTTLRTWR